MERISTTEAARRLGVSRTQLRRMIAAGQVHVEREARPQGSRIVVLWDRPSDEPLHRPARTTATDGDEPRRMVPIEEFAWLKMRLERAEEERAELRRLLNMAHQTIAVQAAQLGSARAIAPTGDEPPVQNGTSPMDGATDPPTVRHRRPWWAWWRRG